MKKLFARATYKRYLPEMMIYIAVWLIVLMVPVVSNFFELLSGKVEVMRWNSDHCLHRPQSPKSAESTAPH